MKKILVILGITSLAFMLFGCGSKTDTTTNTAAATTLQNYDITFTLQGKIMDAITGAAIGGNDLKVYLVQGTTDRTPDKLVTNTSDPLVGEYAFSGIPASLVNATDAVYKVVVVKTGYQRFEANVSFKTTAFNNTVVDAVLNTIGNIYLFPDGTMAGDKDIYVYDPNGLPISGVSVMLQQMTANNSTLPLWTNILSATNGLITNITPSVTDNNGKTTVSGSELVLGGAYTVQVPEMTFNGTVLSANNATFTESSSNLPTIITLPYESVLGELYANSASNQYPGTITPSGALVITLNQAIVTSTTLTCTAATAGGTGDGLLTQGTSTNLTSANYAAAINAAGTTITLTPLITAGTVTTPGASLTWSCANTPLILKSTQSGNMTLLNSPLTDVRNINTGVRVGGTVQLLAY